MDQIVRFLGALFLVTWSASPALSQVNIEKLRRDEGKPGFSGFIRLDLWAQSGSVDVLRVESGGRADYVRQTSTTFLLTRGELAWKEGVRYSSKGLVHLRHVYRLRS